MRLNDPKVTRLWCRLGVGGIRVSFQRLLGDFVLLAMYFMAVYFGELDLGYSAWIKPKQRRRSCVESYSHHRSIGRQYPKDIPYSFIGLEFCFVFEPQVLLLDHTFFW